MRNIQITIDDAGKAKIQSTLWDADNVRPVLAFVGENKATTVTVALPESWATLSTMLIVKVGDSDAQTSAASVGGTLSVVILSSATETEGAAELQIFAQDSETAPSIIKSVTIPCVVLKSLPNATGIMVDDDAVPYPVADCVAATTAATEAAEAANNAASAANAAAGNANTAAGAANTAAENADAARQAMAGDLAQKVPKADIVDDLTSSDGTKVLSAKQGKTLDENKVNTSDIVDNLTSTAADKPLSAKQGKVLSDGKVNVSDIKNNLTSTDTDKPLSAAQGKALQDGKLNKSDLMNSLNSADAQKALTANRGKELDTKKQNKLNVVTLTNAITAVTFADNRYDVYSAVNIVTTLSVSITALPTAGASYSLTFKSGATISFAASTTLTGLTIYHKGEDCVDGEFSPVANTVYDITYLYDGIRMVGYVC